MLTAKTASNDKVNEVQMTLITVFVPLTVVFVWKSNDPNATSVIYSN